MKFVVFFVSLIAVCLAQDHSCKINVPDSCAMKGQFYGSNYNPDRDSYSYESYVGDYYYFANYTGDPLTSMTVTNETIVVDNGTTGQKTTFGWIWLLTIGSTLFTKRKLGGVEQPCQKTEGVTFHPLSYTFHNLKIIYPIPGVPGDPNTPCICQGGFSAKGRTTQGVIMNVEYNHRDTMDQLTYFSQLTDTTHLMSKVESLVPLSRSDAPKFSNPCEHTEVSASSIPEGNHGYIRRVLHKH